MSTGERRAPVRGLSAVTGLLLSLLATATNDSMFLAYDVKACASLAFAAPSALSSEHRIWRNPLVQRFIAEAGGPGRDGLMLGHDGLDSSSTAAHVCVLLKPSATFADRRIACYAHKAGATVEISYQATAAPLSSDQGWAFHCRSKCAASAFDALYELPDSHTPEAGRGYEAARDDFYKRCPHRR